MYLLKFMLIIQAILLYGGKGISETMKN